jgi:hypothetical protein
MTFTEARPFVSNPSYAQDRSNTLAKLDLQSIDRPILDIVADFAELACCFPLQSCFGHFVCDPEQDKHTLAPVPESCKGPVRYRIAYIALCIEESSSGRMLRDELAEIQKIDPACIQFGSADWFWERYLNSYVLQVEPSRYRNRDEAILDVYEARHVQTVRDIFFKEMRNVVRVKPVKIPE